MRPAAIALTGIVSLIFIFAVVAYVQLILLCLAVVLCLIIAGGFMWEGYKRRAFWIPLNQNNEAGNSPAQQNALLNIEGRTFTVQELPSPLEFIVGYRNIHLLATIAIVAIGSALVSLFSADPLLSHLDPDSHRYYQFYFLSYFMAVLLLPALAWLSECALMRAPGITLATVAGQSGTLWIRYQFTDPHGGYYGGTAMDFGGPKKDNLKIVFCSPSNPSVNRLSCALLFHRVTWLTLPKQV
jgi:hypothetical protein